MFGRQCDKRKRRGLSYKKRVADINKIYDAHARDGISNREIWRRYVYPLYAISERQFYNILNASAIDEKRLSSAEAELLLPFDDWGNALEN